MAHTSAHAPSGIDGSPGSSGSSSVFDFDWESADRRVLSQMFPEYAVQALCFFFNLVFNTQLQKTFSAGYPGLCVSSVYSRGKFLNLNLQGVINRKENKRIRRRALVASLSLRGKKNRKKGNE